MSRRQLYEALKRLGMEIKGADPIKALGTILWRASDRIEYVEGRGYWPIGDAVPKLPDTLDELMALEGREQNARQDVTV